MGVIVVPAESILGSNLYDYAKRIVAAHDSVDVTITQLAGRTYMAVCELGFSLIATDAEKVDCVQIPAGDSGLGSSELSLPFGLSFQDSRETVLLKLGRPHESGGGGGFEPLLGRALAPWDAFDLNGNRLHVEYLPDATGIALVSIDTNGI